MTESFLEPFGRRLGPTQNVKKLMKKARGQLKLFVYEPAKDISLEQVRRENRILNVIDDGFWSDVDVLHWMEGWHDAPAKQVLSAGAIFGWGILTSLYKEEILKPAMRDSHARWLLTVVDRVCRMGGSVPWWSNLFQLDNMPDRLEIMPPELLPGKSKRKTKAEAIDTEPPAATVPSEMQSQRQTRSRSDATNGSGGKGGKGSTVSQKGNTNQAGKPPPKGTKKPSTGPSKSRPKSETVITESQDEDELEAESARSSGTDTGRADGSDLKTKDAVEDVGDGESSEMDEGADEGGEGDQTIDTTVGDTTMYDGIEMSVPDGRVLVRDYIDARNPGHLFTRTDLSTGTLHGAYGQDISLRHTRPLDSKWDKEMLRRLNGVPEHKGIVMRNITGERQNFRRSVVKVARLALDMPFGSDFVVTWLAPTISHLKVSFRHFDKLKCLNVGNRTFISLEWPKPSPLSPRCPSTKP